MKTFFDYNYFDPKTLEGFKRNIQEIINLKILSEDSENKELISCLVSDFFTFNRSDCWVTTFSNTKTFYLDKRDLVFTDPKSKDVFTFEHVEDIKNYGIVYVRYNTVSGIYVGSTMNFGERERSAAKESVESVKTNNFLKECVNSCDGVCYTKILHAYPFNNANYSKIKKYIREVEKKYNRALKQRFSYNKVA